MKSASPDNDALGIGLDSHTVSDNAVTRLLRGPSVAVSSGDVVAEIQRNSRPMINGKPALWIDADKRWIESPDPIEVPPIRKQQSETVAPVQPQEPAQCDHVFSDPDGGFVACMMCGIEREVPTETTVGHDETEPAAAPQTETKFAPSFEWYEALLQHKNDKGFKNAFVEQYHDIIWYDGTAWLIWNGRQLVTAT